MYSGLIVWIKSQADGDVAGEAAQQSVFVDSLQVFPWYFACTVLLVFVVYRVRFSGTKSG